MSIGLLTRYGMTKVAGADSTEYTMLESINKSPTTQSLNQRVTSIFSVVDGPITVNAFRIQTANNSTNETVRLWRVSDTTQIASATITPVTGTWVTAAITPIELPVGSYRLMMDSNGSNRVTYLVATSPDVNVDLTIGPRITYEGTLTTTSSAYPSGSPDATRLRGFVDLVYTLA